LFEDEVRAAARALEPYRGSVTIDVEWGNIFAPAAIARLDLAVVMGSPEHRALVLGQLFGDLTEAVLERNRLVWLLTRVEPERVAWDGIQHSVHAFGGEAERDIAREVGHRRRAFDAAVPARAHARCGRHDRDQADRLDRLARGQVRAGPPQGEADPAGRLRATGAGQRRVPAGRATVARAWPAPGRRVHRRR